MEMGLGIWKFTTLVLLFVFVVVFVDNAEGKRKHVVELRQSGSSKLTDDEYELASIFSDCASYWQPKAREKCTSETDVKRAVRGVLNLSLMEGYRKTKELLEMLCATELQYCSQYEGEGCRCFDTGKCIQATRKEQDRSKNCIKEFRAYFEFEKRRRNVGSTVFVPRPQFDYMLWTALLFIVVLNCLY